MVRASPQPHPTRIDVLERLAEGDLSLEDYPERRSDLEQKR